MSKSEKIRPIDAKSLERKVSRHSLWNSEGVIELIRSMPTLDVRCKKQQEGKKDA